MTEPRKPRDLWIHETETSEGWKTDYVYDLKEHEQRKEWSDGFTHYREVLPEPPSKDAEITVARIEAEVKRTNDIIKFIEDNWSMRVLELTHAIEEKFLK